MTAVWTQKEDLVSRTSQHDTPLPRHTSSSESRKRSRSSEVKFQRRHSGGQVGGCEPSLHSDQRNGDKASLYRSMGFHYPLQGLERNISSEVSALRAAVVKAVSEFNEPLGPGLELTAPKEVLEQDSDSGLDGAGKSTDQNSQSDFMGRLGQQKDAMSYSGAGSDVFTQHGCPPHGAKAIIGKRPRMEDAFTAVPFLLEVPVPAAEIGGQPELFPPRIAPKWNGDGESQATASDQDASAHTNVSMSGNDSAAEAEAMQQQELSRSSPAYLETLHFFGVFDGHGGAEAALHCAQTLHQHIAEALAEEMESNGSLAEQNSGKSVPGDSGPASLTRTSPQEDLEMASNISSADHQESNSPPEHRSEAATCSSAIFESALQSAFNRTDEEFGLLDSAALVGTTAVVTLVGSRQLYIANCGDSRAVLCRAGVALPLTDDHKANREDESARVEALGGQILFWNGVRVMGVLAVSRSIGDHCMRPFVIPEPEVTILARRPDDELLLLASDGLWDVLSNQMACTLAKRCLRRARQRGASRQAAARIAATVLTRAATDRGSKDNVTVLVIDLSTESSVEPDDPTTRSQSMMLAVNATDHINDHDPDERMARMQSMANAQSIGRA